MVENNEIEPSEEQMNRLEEILEDGTFAVLAYIDSWEKAKKENKLLLEDSYHHVGRIINCHLVIENLLSNELILLGESPKRLKYNEKINKLPKNGNFYCLLIPGIKQVGKIRNHLAHNLRAEIAPKQMEVIDKYLSIYKKSLPKYLPVEKKIEEFTIMCINMFSLRSPKVVKSWNDFIIKNPNVGKELDDMVKQFEI